MSCTVAGEEVWRQFPDFQVQVNERQVLDDAVITRATFIGTQVRGDYPGKDRDWPRGNPPPDVPYRTSAAKRAAGS